MPHSEDSWWEADLSGDRHALRLAREILTAGPVVLFTEGDRHFLRSDAWDDLREVRAVRARAKALAESLSGSARVILGWSAPLEVGNIVRRHPEGRCDYFLEVQSARMEIRGSPVTLRVTRADGTVEERGPATRVVPWLRAADGREDVRRLLRLMAVPEFGWVELYRISDVILEAGGSSIFEWVSRGEFDRFRHTANSVTAVGDQARHGRERTIPPANPMELSEARRLVLDLSRRLLDSLGREEA